MMRQKKSLGQHFLNSRHVLEQIILAANVKEGETILEIGPGTGILTAALLNAGAKVTAVEKDDRACGLLKEKFSRRSAMAGWFSFTAIFFIRKFSILSASRRIQSSILLT